MHPSILTRYSKIVDNILLYRLSNQLSWYVINKREVILFPFHCLRRRFKNLYISSLVWEGGSKISISESQNWFYIMINYFNNFKSYFFSHFNISEIRMHFPASRLSQSFLARWWSWRGSQAPHRWEPGPAVFHPKNFWRTLKTKYEFCQQGPIV